MGNSFYRAGTITVFGGGLGSLLLRLMQPASDKALKTTRTYRRI